MFRDTDDGNTQAPQIPGCDEGFLRGKQLRNRDTRAECSRPMTSEEVVAEFFKYHPPTPETLPKFAAINQAAKNFAEVVLANCASGADRAAAIRLIRDARMTANAAVALNGLSLY